ncbi:MAG: IS982 family transposase [Leptolyngbyaceae cyanobacterium]
MLLRCYFYTRTGEMTGIAFIDSTPIEVCHPCRAKSHKVCQEQVGWNKNSMGWHFGFKLHLVINERGERLALKLTPANTDDRVPVPEMTQDLIGKLFGDRGYIRQDLFEELYERGLELITNYKKKMKNKLAKLLGKGMRRKRALIETVNDPLKKIFQIEHSRHRSPLNFLVNTLTALVAYTYQEKKFALDLEVKELAALPPAIF